GRIARHGPHRRGAGREPAAAGAGVRHDEARALGQRGARLRRQGGDVARSRKVTVNREGLPPAVQPLLAIAQAVPEEQGARAGEETASWLARVGLGARRAWGQSVSAVTFIGEATLALGRFVTGRARFRWRDLMLVIQECGAQALPIVTLINFLVGMIIAFV